MIQARNKLSQEELSEAKKLINCCQAYDETYRDPYLSNMLNFDTNMPAFFLYYEKGELVGLLTVYADAPTIVVKALRVLYIEVLRKKRPLIQLSLLPFRLSVFF